MRAAARDVAFRRARDQVRRLAEDCADLPQATEAAAVWWEARHVKVEVEPRLVQGLSEAYAPTRRPRGRGARQAASTSSMVLGIAAVRFSLTVGDENVVLDADADAPQLFGCGLVIGGDVQSRLDGHDHARLEGAATICGVGADVVDIESEPVSCPVHVVLAECSSR